MCLGSRSGAVGIRGVIGLGAGSEGSGIHADGAVDANYKSRWLRSRFNRIYSLLWGCWEASVVTGKLVNAISSTRI